MRTFNRHVVQVQILIATFGKYWVGIETKIGLVATFSPPLIRSSILIEGRQVALVCSNGKGGRKIGRHVCASKKHFKCRFHGGSQDVSMTKGTGRGEEGRVNKMDEKYVMDECPREVPWRRVSQEVWFLCQKGEVAKVNVPMTG